MAYRSVRAGHVEVVCSFPAPPGYGTRDVVHPRPGRQWKPACAFSGGEVPWQSLPRILGSGERFGISVNGITHRQRISLATSIGTGLSGNNILVTLPSLHQNQREENLCLWKSKSIVIP